MLNLPKFLCLLIIALTSLQSSSADDPSIIESLEVYLNALKTLKANFKQEDSSGNHSYGSIVIEKPYKFKIETKSPSHNIILGNKSLIMYHDYKVNQTSQTSTESNIFDILLKENIQLNDKKFVIKKLEIDPHNIELEIESKSRKEKANLILIFDRKPIALKQISTEKDGELTSMILYDAEINVPVSENEFKLEYLRTKKRHNRQ